MGELLAVLAPGVLLFAVIGHDRTLRRSRPRRGAALARAIEARGWRYEAKPRGFEVTGEAPHHWRLRARSPQSGSAHTMWEPPLPPAQGVVLVAPIAASPDLGSAMAQLALRAVLGDDETAALRTAASSDAGSEALRQRFRVLAGDEAQARALLSAEAERALLEAPATITLYRSREKLQLWLPTRVSTLEEIPPLVRVGQQLAASSPT